MPQEVMWARTGTCFGGTPTLSTGTGTTNDTTTNNHLLGNEYVVYDDTYGTGRETVLRAVRNMTAFPIAASMAVLLDPSGTQILGATTLDAQGPSGQSSPGPVAIVDDHLIGTVAQYDICYVVVKGLFLGITGTTNLTTNVIAKGDPLNCCTCAGTSGNASAGRLKTRVFPANFTAGMSEQEGVFAYALSAVATSGQTNTGYLATMWRQVGG